MLAGEGSYDPTSGPVEIANLGKTMSRTERELIEAAQEEEEELKRLEDE